MSVRAALVGGILCVGVLGARASAAENPSLVYIGTYTGGRSKGIYYSRFDPATGKLTQPELAAEANNPSFLAAHPNGRWLYAIGELSATTGPQAGIVAAYRLDAPSGRLTLLNQEASGGEGPCHVSVDPSGSCVLVANYGSGSIAGLPLQEDGRLKPASVVIQHHGSGLNRERQEGPHAHFIIPDPDNRFVLNCDLGLDQVLVYKFEPGRCGLSPNQPPFTAVEPGVGPRHLVFHPNGRLAYLITEMGSTITGFTYDPQLGTLKAFQTVSTLPPDFHGLKSGAEIQVHPNGRFLYGSNRGDNSIVVFAIDQASGRLTYVEHQNSGGKVPRYFAFDPSGQWMLVENQDSDNIVVFRVSPETGRLTPTGHQVAVPNPVCAVFPPRP